MQQVSNKSQSQIEHWFDDFIATLRTHQVQLETNTATQEIKSMYDALIGEDPDEIYKHSKLIVQKHFVGKIIFEYLKLLGQDLPNKLAFDFDDARILVWAEVDNEEMENELFIAEAKINSRFKEYGYGMSTTVVEKEDNLSIPPHYRSVK